MAFRGKHAIPLLLSVVAMCAANWGRAQGEHPLDPNWPTYHARDLGESARKFGLSTAVLRELLRAVGREGDYDYYIGKVDAVSLKKRGQVFLSIYDFGTAAALTVYVIDTRTPYYRKIWEAAGTAHTAFMTASILGRATASVDPQGEIVVRLPIWNGEGLLSKENSDLTVVQYKWTGKTYRLDSEKRFHRYKWNGKDWEVLAK
jgi:hypothetical protein